MITYEIHLEFVEAVLGTASSDPEIHERYIASKAPDAKSLKEEVAALGTDAVEDRSMTRFPHMEDGTPFLWDYQIKGFCKDACKMMRYSSDSASKKVTNYLKKIDGCIFPSPRKIALHIPDCVYTTPRKGISVTVEPIDDDYFNITMTANEDAIGSIPYDPEYINYIEVPLLADGRDIGKTVELDEDMEWTRTVKMSRRIIHSCQRPLRAQTAMGERIALANSEELPAGTWCDFKLSTLIEDAQTQKAIVEWFQYGFLRGIGQWRNSGKGRFGCVVKRDGKVVLDTLH